MVEPVFVFHLLIFVVSYRHLSPLLFHSTRQNTRSAHAMEDAREELGAASAASVSEGMRATTLATPMTPRYIL